MGNVSTLVDIKWYLGKDHDTSVQHACTERNRSGIPFNDTNWRLQIAELGENILGDRLLGLQASNEPDLYARFVLMSLLSLSSLILV